MTRGLEAGFIKGFSRFSHAFSKASKRARFAVTVQPERLKLGSEALVFLLEGVRLRGKTTQLALQRETHFLSFSELIPKLGTAANGDQ